jgi:hypothetical protein
VPQALLHGPKCRDRAGRVPEHLERLRERGLSGKRSLALREFALGTEGLERFAQREPLRRVHECVSLRVEAGARSDYRTEA